MQVGEERRANRANRRGQNNNDDPTTPSQRAFWQAITVGELETMQVLLEHRDIDINKMDEKGEQRLGCTALHLAILEMPTWKSEGRVEGRNGIQTAEFVKKFFTVLLEHGADIDRECKYTGEWYLQTAAGKTKSFYPDGYDALGLVLQFVEITRGAEVISTNVTKRLELIRDLLLEHIKNQSEPRLSSSYGSIVDDMSKALQSGKFTDIDLVSEGEIISCHRVILAARSSVFEAMLGSENFKESRSRRVDIDQTDPAALRLFVQFLYEDTLDSRVLSTDFQLCHSLIMLSNRYDVKALKVKCAEIIYNHHLTKDKAVKILAIADENQVESLHEKTLHFISKDVQSIMSSKDFQTLDPELIKKILKTVATKPTPKRHLTSMSPTNSGKRSRNNGNADSYSDDEAVRAPPNNQEDNEEEEEL